MSANGVEAMIVSGASIALGYGLAFTDVKFGVGDRLSLRTRKLLGYSAILVGVMNAVLAFSP